MYKVEVIEVTSFTKIASGHNITVKAKTEEGKTFSYVFIKNDEAEARSIVAGYTWVMGCKPKAF